MVGTGGFEPHGSLTPIHDAEADLRTRQRDIRNLGRHFLGLALWLGALVALLLILSLAAGVF